MARRIFPPSKNIRTDTEMTIFMQQLFEHTLTVVIDKLLVELQDIIQKEVYDKGTPSAYPRQYKRGGFYSSWYAGDAGGISGTSDIEAVLSHQPFLMNHFPNDFIHGSNYWSIDDDIRPILADIIINGITGNQGEGHKVGPFFSNMGVLHNSGSSINHWWEEERDFWTPFIVLLNSGEVEKLIKDELNRLGIEFLPA